MVSELPGSEKSSRVSSIGCSPGKSISNFTKLKVSIEFAIILISSHFILYKSTLFAPPTSACRYTFCFGRLNVLWRYSRFCSLGFVLLLCILLNNVSSYIHPRMLLTVDENLKPVPVSVRVGQDVDDVSQAARPTTKTHLTPIVLAAADRAELATKKYIPLSTILEGFVILK